MKHVHLAGIQFEIADKYMERVEQILDEYYEIDHELYNMLSQCYGEDLWLRAGHEKIRKQIEYLRMAMIQNVVVVLRHFQGAELLKGPTRDEYSVWPKHQRIIPEKIKSDFKEAQDTAQEICKQNEILRGLAQK